MSSNTKTASDFLQTGIGILSERGKTYDKDNQQQERSMAKVVQVFAIITGKQLTETEGWQFMACLKQVRAWQRPDFHSDSWQDGINYLALGAEAKAQEACPQIGMASNIPEHIKAEGTFSFIPTEDAILELHAWDLYAREQKQTGLPVCTWKELPADVRAYWIRRIKDMSTAVVTPAPNS